MDTRFSKIFGALLNLHRTPLNGLLLRPRLEHLHQNGARRSLGKTGKQVVFAGTAVAFESGQEGRHEKKNDLERLAAEAAANGDLAQAAGLLEKAGRHHRRSHTLAWIYQQLAHEAPDPRTRLRLELVTTEGWWERAWEQTRQIINRAWRAYETAEGRGPLNRALTEVHAALEVWPHLVALRETEARILMRLGRDEEAFAVVHWIDECEPDRAELADLRASAAYRSWVEDGGLLAA